MSAINEAYARIDYSYLKQLEAKIEALENIVDSLNENAQDDIDGDEVAGFNKRFVARRIKMSDKKPTQKITFSPSFPQRPTVVFGVQDNSGVFRNVVITELNSEFVKFNVVKNSNQKTNDGNFTLHMIAMGKKE